jgi:hypothetical protein
VRIEDLLVAVKAICIPFNTFLYSSTSPSTLTNQISTFPFSPIPTRCATGPWISVKLTDAKELVRKEIVDLKVEAGIGTQE